MKIRSFGLVASLIGILILVVPLQTQAMFLVDTQGGVQVWSLPQAAPGPGFAATKIVLKATDPTAKLAVFENVAFNGDVVQSWWSGPSGGPTAKGVPVPGPTYAVEWISYDSHLLIEPSQVGGGVGGGYIGITETNDGSIGAIPGLPDASGFPPISGVGAIAMVNPTDAFFLDTPFQLFESEIAYLVTRTDNGSKVTMTLGVLGLGFVNSGEPDGAQWGFGGNPDPLDIPFTVSPTIPEPITAAIFGLMSLGVLGTGGRRRAA